MRKSPSSLHSYLTFYRDLGIEDLFLPGWRARRRATPVAALDAEPPRGSGAGRPGETPHPRKRRPPEPPAAVASPSSAIDLPPKSDYRPPRDLFSAGETGGESPRKDPLAVLQEITADIGDCTRCQLHKGRTQIVFGVGNPNAKLVFVGEGPGADEDAQGIPFVGRAGQLLTQMINNTAKGEGIPITREDVYICNVVKCRPPGNRAPEADEMETCGQFLNRQLDAIRPKAICVLGGTAAKYLLDTRQGIMKIRGQWHEWRGIPVMPTFHPSFLLRGYNQSKKREAWQDLKNVLHYVYD